MNSEQLNGNKPAEVKTTDDLLQGPSPPIVDILTGRLLELNSQLHALPQSHLRPLGGNRTLRTNLQDPASICKKVTEEHVCSCKTRIYKLANPGRQTASTELCRVEIPPKRPLETAWQLLLTCELAWSSGARNRQTRKKL